ncbi:L,D-transpeptidase [Cohaesibacter intestini]|uniref:L,D-transpeptidase n=1 Tax=Cohaesibacter intestini TaxID=2211145 RepID=UPI000DEACA74|nr:L,D-transpeptidase [Cohaesibacter intestini]
MTDRNQKSLYHCVLSIADQTVRHGALKWTMMACLALALALTFQPRSAEAKSRGVHVTIDISSQKMFVTVNGKRRHTWTVSTARRGYRTPIGKFRPTRMHRRYYSKRYRGAPMPHSIFFYRGYAIHGTNAIKRLGRPASHGCIRLHPDNARTLFDLVRRNGPRNTRIAIRR